MNELLVLDIEGIGVYYRCKSASEEHSRKSDYERLYIEICDEQTLTDAESKTDEERYKKAREYISAVKVEIDGTAHAYQRHDAADRDIYTACYHDEAQSAGDDYERCIVVEQIEERLRF